MVNLKWVDFILLGYVDDGCLCDIDNETFYTSYVSTIGSTIFFKYQANIKVVCLCSLLNHINIHCSFSSLATSIFIFKENVTSIL